MLKIVFLFVNEKYKIYEGCPNITSTIFKYVLRKWSTVSMPNINIDFDFFTHVYDTMKLNFSFRDTYPIIIVLQY